MNDLIINGKSKVSGGTFGEVRMDGISSVEGDLVCDTMELNGTCRFKGNVRISGRAEIDGVCKVSGDMDTEDLDLDGCLTVAGGLTAENARLNGALTVNGTFNVGTLDMKFHGSSKVKEVVGGRIRIYHGKSTRYFRAELIEGDDIDIERSKIKVVIGDNVTIGAGCTVERVEYSGGLEIHPKASVKEKIKADQGK
ncbi:MAG: hypothetical protein FWH45_00910 [Methanomassiliicoccaceae archaeon]|nr:hypothetical protein [Methanomassiliicoccaceae archaeon]MCL2145730.1 hypothetical protein [Methanomassiliicoccaceae archaeon]